MTEQEVQRIPRLVTLLKALNINNKDFAVKTGINQQSVSHLLSGYRPITLSRIYQIKSAFPEVNEKWLEHGDGQPFLGGETDDEKISIVSEPAVKYERTDPLSALRALLEEHGRRIGEIEERLNRLEGK